MPAADGGPSWWKLTQAAGATADGTTWYAAPYADIPTSNGVPRPWLVEFYQCRDVVVSDITLTNAPMWNLVFRYSSNVSVSELSVTVTPDPRVPDTDGIDVIGSSTVSMIFLNIDNGGASVALKSGLKLNVPIADDRNEAGLPQLATHDVQIVNSEFADGNGIVVGGEAANGVYNVLANNITGTNLRHGLVIRSDRNGGNQATGDYNILAQNMTLTGVARPLVISAYDLAADGSVAPPDDPPRPVTPTTANIHDITVRNLTATGATGTSLIVGLPEACIRNVVLEKVSIAGDGAGLQLRNITGKFTDATVTPKAGNPGFLVQQNVTVATAGTTPAIAGTPSQPACVPRPDN
jgi:polygalacturonase